MSEASEVKKALETIFPAVHVSSAMKHYTGAAEQYQQEDWEQALLKIGKTVESILKGLYVYAGNILPPARKFKVNDVVQKLGQASSSYDDTVRLTIPRACVFVYDIVSNRGTRHDSEEFDPNKMDASVAMPVVSWILSEMVRFAGKTAPGDSDVMTLTESLMEKQHPIFETIEGRTYINHQGLSPKEAAILLLYAGYPKRIDRKSLSTAIDRHGRFTKNAVAVALTNIKDLVDDDGNGQWKLREIGRQKAVTILASLKH